MLTVWTLLIWLHLNGRSFGNTMDHITFTSKEECETNKEQILAETKNKINVDITLIKCIGKD